jgi:hypothetical protein
MNIEKTNMAIPVTLSIATAPSLENTKWKTRFG